MFFRLLNSDRVFSVNHTWFLLGVVLTLLGTSSSSFGQHRMWEFSARSPEEGGSFGKKVAMGNGTVLMASAKTGAVEVFRRDPFGWSYLTSLRHSSGGRATDIEVDGTRMVMAANGSGIIDVYADEDDRWRSQWSLDMGSDTSVLDVDVSGDVIAAIIKIRDERRTYFVALRWTDGWWIPEARIEGNFNHIAASGDWVVLAASDSPHLTLYRNINNDGQWTYYGTLGSSSRTRTTDLDMDYPKIIVSDIFATGFRSEPVEIFRRTGSHQWQRYEIRHQRDPARGSMYGWSVAIEGDVVVIGANEDGDDYARGGSIRIARYNADLDRWESETPIFGRQDPDDEIDFGSDVDIQGAHIAAGAAWQDIDRYRDAGGGYVIEIDFALNLAPPFPGVAGEINSIGVQGANPGEIVYFAYSFDLGEASIPGCPGVYVDLDSPELIDFAYADINGNATIHTYVPEGAAGLTVLLQAVEHTTCRVSDLIEHTFH